MFAKYYRAIFKIVNERCGKGERVIFWERFGESLGECFQECLIEYPRNALGNALSNAWERVSMDPSEMPWEITEKGL